MHLIDEDGHVDNMFTEGSPGAGQEATLMGSDWPNMVQLEMYNFITAAGLTPDKNDQTQMLQAFQKMNGGPGATLRDLYVADDWEPGENDTVRQTLVFAPGQNSVEWNSVELWRSGVAWRIAMELMTSGTSTTNIAQGVAYLVVAAGAANPIVKERWGASQDYEVGDMIIPPLTALNGYYYVCSTAGTSGASAPTWGTTPGGYTTDNSVTWTCYAGGMKLLSTLVAPPGAAFQRFDFDDEDLTIPSGEAGAGDLLILGFIRHDSDSNPDDMHLRSARVYEEEV